MKNIFRILMAVAVLLTASCAKEDISSSIAGGEVEVTFTANLQDLGSRAYGDGSQVNTLRFSVYDAVSGDKLTQLCGQKAPISASTPTTVNLVLLKGMKYNITFWADHDAMYDFNGQVVTVDYDNVVANDEERDAFYAYVKEFDPADANADTTIELYRPFAQLNAISTDAADALANSGVTISKSTVKAELYNSFNLTDGTVSNRVEKTLTAGDILSAELLSMNYLFAPAEGYTPNVTFTFENNKSIDFGASFTYVPLKRNYRTNIIGSLLTKPTDFTVEIETGFNKEEISVVTNAAALKDAIIKGGKIELANDITVDEWIMFSETKSISSGQIITVKMDGLTIDGKAHTLTVNDIESASNGNLLFEDASNLNIKNLTIKYANGVAGGISLKSGVISKVNFVGGNYGIYPGVGGEILVEDCTFATNADALYFEQERDNLTINRCTFNQPAEKNVVLLRGDVKFTNNIVNSGRTVNVVSGSPEVTGNNFNDVRFKVYPAATATIANNTINNLVFETDYHSSTFTNNTLSAAAQKALNAVTVKTVSTYSEIVDAVKNGYKIEFASDITVDEWIMFSETKTISSGQIITVKMDGLTIDGKGHTLTVNDIESASNGNLLFEDASNLNIKNLTIKYANGVAGGISLKSGVISKVNFVGGIYGIYPGVGGDILVEDCTFATNADALYFEQERDNLTINRCTFNQPANVNVVLLRGDVKFTNNIVNSGRTVNVVSGSPEVTGNNFNSVRLKVYSAATATIANNTINNLAFEDGKTTHSSTFTNNTLSAEAQAALNAMN